jgi:hypothetical protein
MVPVREGGTHVPASVLVFDDSVTMRDARVMLYRRETGRLHASSASPEPLGSPSCQASRGTSTCLYAALQPNIRPLTAEKLAELTVCGAAAPSGAGRRHGISYLQQQRHRGVALDVTGH